MPDQMRGDCLSLEGHPCLLTPNMDEIGAQGGHFESAYTTSASCIPARRSLLTGQFPASNGLVGYQNGVPIKSITLPQILQDSGYFTILVGRNMHQYPPENSYGYQKRVLGSTYEEDDDTDCGVDGFVLEPLTDIEYIAENYGDSHVFIGNADTRILLKGTNREIRAEVQRCMGIGKNIRDILWLWAIIFPPILL